MTILHGVKLAPRTDAPDNPVLEAAALPLDEYFAGSPLGSGVEAGRSR